MGWMVLLAVLSQDPAPERVEKARARLLEMVVSARREKEDADKARAAAEENRKKAEQLLDFARKNATDEVSKKAVAEEIPRMIEDARCLGDRSAAASRAADARIRLTEKALANLKLAAPSGPVQAALSKLGRWASTRVDAEFAETHGFLSDPVAEKRLGSLLDKVVPFAPYASERPRLKIVKGSFGGLRAFTTTDTIYILEDELKRKPSDEDLLILLGHELAHAQMGHYASFYAHLEKETKLEKLQGTGAAEPEIAEYLHEKAVQARTSQYSVEQELEAEVLGAQMAIAAGASPAHIVKSLENEAAEWARQVANARPPQVAQHRLVRTHPEPQETLRKLKDVLGPGADSR